MKRILIVEDELPIAEIERDYLEMEGFEVLIITDGALGLNAAENENFDLIILDLMLPGMDGLEICKRIRKKKDTPIIMVTARTESIDKVRGLGLGANDYIEKPFVPAELVARVKANIANYDRVKGNIAKNGVVLNFGALSIQPLARRVTYDKQDIILTVKEFDLLYFLASNPNEVFSREVIFDKVWGMDSNGDTHTVVVHITHLREKIPCDRIETVRGVGYRFSFRE